jgi:dihydroorotase
MPNTKPHVTDVKGAQAYYDEIMRAVPKGIDFTPLMTLSLTANTMTKCVELASRSPIVIGFKLYAGQTTNAAGIEDMGELFPIFKAMERNNIPLLLHGEASKVVDVFDREAVFYTETLPRIVDHCPDLRIVCEHITSRVAVDFVSSHGPKIGATITPQHLVANRNDMLGSGILPDHYCMPIMKTKEDQQALLDAATSGNPKFWLGTDSAPHQRSGPPGVAKYSACGCAGCFTAPHALALYAEAFDSRGALNTLEDFASRFGAEFYGLPLNNGTVTLNREEWKLLESYHFGVNRVTPFRQNKPVQWRVTHT